MIVLLQKIQHPKILNRNFNKLDWFQNNFFTSSKTQVDIKKSPNDKRNYKYIKLKNNLECILIEDPETQKSAASLVVKAGALQDPLDREGLAHFCEHMLFLGSQKYPKQDQYRSYLTKNSGSCNASTSPYNTKYYFQVQNDAFNQAVDIFANCLISPLFNEDCVDRELNAIENEHQKNIQSDSRKIDRVFRLSTCENSVWRRFQTGNLRTLKYPDIRERLIEFHKKYYSANQMKLVLYSQQSLDKLTELAKIFEHIPDYNKEDNVWIENTFPKDKWNKMIKIQTEQQRHQLKFSWLIDYQQDNYQNTPASYLAHILGTEVKGCILSMLMEQDLALELSAGYEDCLKKFSIFNISVQMTEKGQKNMDQIRNIIFKYIQMMKENGIQKRIFDEQKLIRKILFDNMEQNKALEQANLLSSRLSLDINREDILEYGYLKREFRPDLIQKTMEFLNADNLRIQYISHQALANEEKENIQVEDIYNTHFCIKELPQIIKKEFQNPVLNFKTNLSLDIPSPNRFLPNKLQFKGGKLKNQPSIPQKIYESNKSEIWFKQDEVFKTPKLVSHLTIYSANLNFHQSLIKCSIYNSIFLKLFRQHLKELLYEASEANLNCNFSSSLLNGVGFDISVFGFDESIPSILNEVLHELGQFNPQNQDKFNDLLQKMKEGFYNFFKQSPHSQISFYNNSILQDQIKIKEDQFKYFQEANFEEFQQYIADYLKQVRYEWLILGNMEKQEAIQMAQNAEKIFENSQKVKGIVDLNVLPSVRCAKLQSGCNYYYEQQMELEDKNSCITKNYQFEPTLNIKNGLIIDIIINIIRSLIFNQLRTNEQLGYIVQTYPIVNHSVLSIQIRIQSSSKNPQYLAQRIDKYINELQTDVIDKLDQNELNIIKKSVKTNLKEKDTSIYREFNRYYQEIDLHRYDFDRKQQKILALDEITLEEVQNAFKQIFGNKTAKVLEVHLIGLGKEEEYQISKQERIEQYKQENIKYIKIEDIKVFKKTLEYYPAYNAKL